MGIICSKLNANNAKDTNPKIIISRAVSLRQELDQTAAVSHQYYRDPAISDPSDLSQARMMPSRLSNITYRSGTQHQH